MDETDIARLTRERDEAREERDRARRDYEGACHLVAKMHHAATGAVTGPERGVVGDVADVRARMLAAEPRAAAAEKERDEARERVAGLSRELLTALQARDSYRASAELRVGMRREFEELLNVGDTMAPETFEAGLVRLRALLAAESRAEKAERERDAYRHEWNVSSRQQGAETRARYAAEAKAERLAKALRHCARELQYVLDADPCEQREIHQSGEAKACVALAESLLGPMRGWPEGPNAGMLAVLAEVGE